MRMDKDNADYMEENRRLRKRIAELDAVLLPQAERIREQETLCAYWRDGYTSRVAFNAEREEVFLKRIRELEAENARLVERVAELEDLERRMDWKGEDA